MRSLLINEDFIHNDELEYISKRNPKVGMTLCGIIASIGKPDTSNTTELAKSKDVQMIYRDRGIYVYLTINSSNPFGIVKAIQH